MGVHGLWNILEPTGKPVNLQSLQGKVLAVDVSIWLHQAVKGFRDKDGNPLKNAHLLGVFFRVCKLLNYGIKPIFVFDGGVPVLKRQTLSARKNKKLEAQDQSEITRRKLLSNLIRTQLQKQTKQAIPPSVLIQAGIKELTSSSKRARTPNKGAKRKANESSDSDESTSNSAFGGSAEAKQAPPEEDSSSDDDFRGGRNYVEHFSSITSSDFDSLPLEIQHEILFDMQESKKNNSWANVHEMPKELHNFSSFQMDRLVKRRFLQKKIQSVQKEMGNRHIHVQNLDELLDFESEFDGNPGETEIIGSKERGAVLIKVKPGSGPSSSKQEPLTVAAPKTEPEVITIDDYVDEWPSSDEDTSARKTTAKDEEDEDAQLAMAIELSLQQPKETGEIPSLKGEGSNGGCTMSSDGEDNDALDAEVDDVIDQLDREEQDRKQKAIEIPPQKSEDSVPAKSSKREISRSHFNEVLREAGSSSSTCSKFFDYVGLFEVPEKQSTISASEVIEKAPIEKDNSASSTDDDDFEEVPMQQAKAPSPSKFTSQDKAQQLSKAAGLAITIDKNMKYDKEKDIFSDLFEDIKSPTKNTKVPEVVEILFDEDKNEMSCDSPVSHNEEKAEAEESIPIANLNSRTPPQPAQRMITMGFMQNQERLNSEQRNLHNVMGQQDRLATSITDQMYIETQELLSLFGVPYIVSPMEAESQCAFLDSVCLTDGTVTDDSDIWLFGGKRVYKNFFSQGERTVEFFQYSDIVQELNLDREKLILMAILIGSDYTNGIDGVGPITALEILAEFPSDSVSSFESLIKFRDWWKEAHHQKQEPQSAEKVRSKLKQFHLKSGFPSKAVYDAYMDPTIDTSLEKVRWGTIDKESIKTYTRSKFGWNESKCEANLLPVLNSIESSREKQLTLDKFITLRPLVNDKPQIKSKRLANAMKKLKKSFGDLADEVALSSDDSSDSELQKPATKTVKKRVRTNNPSTSKGQSHPPTTPTVKKVKIPKPVQEIPQKIQAEARQKQNKLRAAEILKNKK